MIVTEDRWFQVASRVNAAVYAALDPKPCRSGVVPGSIAWDDCNCGLLATTVGTSYPSDEFPTEQVGITGNCEAAWEVVEIIVQIVRCAPGPTGATATPPTVKALSSSASQVDKDGNQMTAAVGLVLCQMKDAFDISDFLVTRRIPQGPQGGCVGSEQHMLVALPRTWPWLNS
jgi:hypothetical protein